MSINEENGETSIASSWNAWGIFKIQFPIQKNEGFLFGRRLPETLSTQRNIQGFTRFIRPTNKTFQVVYANIQIINNLK